MSTLFNKVNLLILIIGIIIGGVLMYLLQKPTIVEVPVKVTVEIEVPVIEKEFDTIKEPYPIYIKGDLKIDSTYYNKWLMLTDSIAKNELIKDLITIREYNTKYEDDFLTLNIYSKTRGTLLEIKPDYKTKPKTIKLDTIIDIKIPKYNKLLGGIEIGYPLDSKITNDVLFKGNVMFQNKKDNIYSISLDSEKRIWAGFNFNF